MNEEIELEKAKPIKSLWNEYAEVVHSEHQTAIRFLTQAAFYAGSYTTLITIMSAANDPDIDFTDLLKKMLEEIEEYKKDSSL